MSNTIKELWNCNIAPGENCGVGIPEIEKLAMLIELHKQKLDQQLDQQQKITFEKYVDCVDEYAVLLSEQAFCDGFCIASKLIAEALA